MAIITVSKEFGSGGTDIARMLAKTLKYQYVDKGLVLEVARRLKVRPEEVEEWDMESHSEWKAHVSKYFDLHPFKGGFMFQGPFSEPSEPVPETPGFIDTTIYQKMTQTLIEELAARDNVVILGRGGQAILRDRPTTLHVRVICPLKKREVRIMKHRALNHIEAEELILETDRRSLKYVRHYYDTDAADPHNYHLVVNTGRMELHEAVETIMGSLERLEATVKEV
jgi:cytidylate kinase